jgi:hypothetical protein
MRKKNIILGKNDSLNIYHKLLRHSCEICLLLKKILLCLFLKTLTTIIRSHEKQSALFNFRISMSCFTGHCRVLCLPCVDCFM